jgi:hypothetical protein
VSEAHAAVVDMLATAGGPEALAEAAATLLREPWWLAGLLSPWLSRLAGDPWYEPPLRAARDPRRTSAVLVEGADAALTATVLHATPDEPLVATSGRLAVTRYHRAGGARLLSWDAGGSAAAFRFASAPPLVARPDEPLADGAVRALDGRRHAFALAAATAPVVTLTVAPRSAGLSRAYDRASGRLVRVAGNDMADARRRMLLTLLRVSERRDAAAQFDAATRAPAHDLRWAAMREWLALDAGAALPRLRALADDPHPEVRAAARATLPLVEARLFPA